MATLLEQKISFDFLGKLYEDRIICEIADGKICPIELRAFVELPVDLKQRFQ